MESFIKILTYMKSNSANPKVREALEVAISCMLKEINQTKLEENGIK